MSKKVNASEKICILPWTSFYFEASGKLFPCCLNNNSLGELDDRPLLEQLNSRDYINFRKSFLKGDIPKGCEVCYENEARIGYSMRTEHKNLIEQYCQSAPPISINPDGTLDNLDIRTLDMRPSNLCNLKCRFCWITSSHRWGEDLHKLQDNKETIEISYKKNKIQLTKNNHLWKTNFKLSDFNREDITNLTYVKFAGGEPLIMTETYQTLTHLIEIKKTDVHVRFVTNLMKFGDMSHRLFDYLKYFKSYSFAISIDGCDERIEYMRSGSRWNKIVENFDALMSFSKEYPSSFKDPFRILFALYFLNFQDWFEDLKFLEKKLKIPIKLNISTSPILSRVDALPTFFIDKFWKNKDPSSHWALTQLHGFLQKSKFNDEDRFSCFIKYLGEIDALDKVRDEAFFKAFPNWKLSIERYLEVLTGKELEKVETAYFKCLKTMDQYTQKISENSGTTSNIHSSL